MKTVKTFRWVIISFFLAFIICLFQFYSYLGVLQEISRTEKKADGGYIFYDLQHESNPLNSDLKVFTDLYDSLKSNGEYTYYEMSRQYLEMPNQAGLFYEYGTGELQNKCEGINCVQLSENLMKNCVIDVSEGRAFTSDDFLHRKNAEVPVLMGNSYVELFETGDIFEAEYLFDSYRFKVIGFLPEGSSIHMASQTVDLDKYIVMPSFSIVSDVPVTDGLKIHYANKTSGIVRLEEADAAKFDRLVLPLLENTEAGNYSWTVAPVEYQFKELFGIGIGKAKAVIMFCAILLIFSEICLIYKFSVYKKNDYRFFCSQNLFYGVLTFVLASAVCIFIDFICRAVLGIKIITYYNFTVIGLLSFLAVLLDGIVYKYKKDRRHRPEA